MTARIIPLEPDEHREVQALLPWLTNGTLAPAELERVHRHLALCDRCQADVAWLEGLRGLAAAAPVPGSDMERDWAAMRGKMAPREDRAWLRRGWPVLLVGGQAAMILVLAVVLATRTASQDAEYRTLGNTAAAPAANTLVVFRPGATEQEVRRALRSVKARIVDGPTATDAYLLYVPLLTADEVGRLRSDPAVTRVESLQGGKP